MSSADVYFEQNQLHMQSWDTKDLTFGIYPKAAKTPDSFHSRESRGIFEEYSAQITPVHITPKIEKVKDAALRNSISMGKEVATAPTESAFDGAARWSIQVPSLAAPAAKNAFLRITYQGDVARLYDQGKLVDDDFYKGTPWDVGLRSLVPADSDPVLELRILPLPKGAPIYLAPGAQPSFPASGQVAKLKDVRLIPEYEAVADLNP